MAKFPVRRFWLRASGSSKWQRYAVWTCLNILEDNEHTWKNQLMIIIVIVIQIISRIYSCSFTLPGVLLCSHETLGFRFPIFPSSQPHLRLPTRASRAVLWLGSSSKAWCPRSPKALLKWENCQKTARNWENIGPLDLLVIYHDLWMGFELILKRWFHGRIWWGNPSSGHELCQGDFRTWRHLGDGE